MINLIFNIYIYGTFFAFGFCCSGNKETLDKLFPNNTSDWMALIGFSILWPLTIGHMIYLDYKENFKNIYLMIKKQLSDFDKEVMKFKKK